MSILIDIVGSLVIAGIIMLAILGLNVNMNQAMYDKTFALITQSNAVTLARMIEFDFVKIGYHSTKPNLLVAKSDSISFRGDMGDDGTVRTVRYYVGAMSTLGSTKNPNDRLIYRVQDGTVTPMNLGVTNMSFSYYNADGFATLNADSVRSISVIFTVQSSEPVDTTYTTAFWQKKIFPKNLN